MYVLNMCLSRHVCTFYYLTVTMTYRHVPVWHIGMCQFGTLARRVSRPVMSLTLLEKGRFFRCVRCNPLLYFWWLSADRCLGFGGRVRLSAVERRPLAQPGLCDGYDERPKAASIQWELSRKSVTGLVLPMVGSES